MSASEPSADELPDPALPSTAPSMSVLVTRPVAEPPAELPVLSNRAMALATVALIIVGVGMAAGLLLVFGNGQHTDQLNAIKTAGTIVVGTGGAAALWLTARRQRTTEIALNQTRAAHVATVADADARRVTDLYAKAADQLGSSQAPVRLAGLYALERLAQENPAAAGRLGPQAPRDGAVDVARAAPGAQDAAGRRRTGTAGAAGRAEHPDPPPQPGDPDNPYSSFWSRMHIDLTGALLGPANMIGWQVTAADFTRATFTSDVWLSHAEFGLDAVFTGVRFGGSASWQGDGDRDCRSEPDVQRPTY